MPHIILNNIQQGERAEDLRVLYVALTRAEQRLIITASFNETRRGQKLVEAWNGWQKAFQSNQQLIGSQLRISVKSFMDWIGLALARYSKQFNAAKLSISGDDITDKGIILEDSPVLIIGRIGKECHIIYFVGPEVGRIETIRAAAGSGFRVVYVVGFLRVAPFALVGPRQYAETAVLYLECCGRGD